MKEVAVGTYEDKDGNLVDASGKVLVPAEKRTKCEIFSRIVGYMRPVSGWNKGKQAEWKDRKVFTAPKIDSPEPHEGGDA